MALSLETLSPDAFFCIAGYLTDKKDILALAYTCRAAYRAFYGYTAHVLDRWQPWDAFTVNATDVQILTRLQHAPFRSYGDYTDFMNGLVSRNNQETVNLVFEQSKDLIEFYHRKDRFSSTYCILFSPLDLFDRLAPLGVMTMDRYPSTQGIACAIRLAMRLRIEDQTEDFVSVLRRRHSFVLRDNYATHNSWKEGLLSAASIPMLSVHVGVFGHLDPYSALIDRQFLAGLMGITRRFLPRSVSLTPFTIATLMTDLARQYVFRKLRSGPESDTPWVATLLRLNMSLGLSFLEWAWFETLCERKWMLDPEIWSEFHDLVIWPRDRRATVTAYKALCIRAMIELTGKYFKNLLQKHHVSRWMLLIQTWDQDIYNRVHEDLEQVREQIQTI